MTSLFYDSARYLLIPRGKDALLYNDGKYRVPESAAARFDRVRYITVLGGSHAAHYAGAIDYEHGNAAYHDANLIDWVDERAEMKTRARVYCNRSDFSHAFDIVGHKANVRWWIATLDNDQRTAAEVTQMLEKIRPGFRGANLWALQFHNQPEYDTSELFGVW